MPKPSHATAKARHLQQFVSYREVAGRPVQLAPNRVGWQVETLTTWLDEQSRGLVAHAVAHPGDLPPATIEVAPWC